MSVIARNELGNFFDKAEGKTYVLNEGNFTVDDGISTVTGKREVYGKFANEIRPLNFVNLDLGADKEFQATKATGDYAHMIVEHEPHLPGGMIPQTNVTDGSYQRYATCFTLPVGEIGLPLKATNVAITAGDKLHLDSYNTGLDKETASTSVSKVIALENKPANAGGLILCRLEEHKIPIKS